MELPNELQHLILTLLDDFTKYRLYTSSRSIPYLDRLKIREGGTIINDWNDGKILDNLYIKKLTIFHVLPYYPYGLDTLHLDTIYQNKQPIPTTVIRRLIVNITNNLSEEFLNMFRVIVIRDGILKNVYLPNLKKLKITTSEYHKDEIKLCEMTPNLKYVEVIGSVNICYDNLPSLRVTIKQFNAKKIFFDLTPNIVSLSIGPVDNVIFNSPNNLKLLKYKFAPELYHSKMTHLIITDTGSTKNKLDLSNYDLIYLKLPQIFWIVNGEKLLNKSLKTLDITEMMAKMPVLPIDKFIIDNLGEWGEFYRDDSVSWIEYHNSIPYHMTIICDSKELVLPHNLVSLKLVGQHDKITLPDTLKKLILHLDDNSGNITLPSGLKELTALIPSNIILKGDMRLRYLEYYYPIFPCDIFQKIE